MRKKIGNADATLDDLAKLVRELESFTSKMQYKPTRTLTPGKGPPEHLGKGLVAINIPDRRLWIGTFNAGTVEVKSVDELIDRWVEVIEHA